MYAADTLHLHRRIPWRIGTAAVARPDGCAHRHHREANWPHLTAIGRWGGRWGARRWDYHIRPQSAAQSIPPDAAAHGLPSSNGGVGSIGATLRDGGSSPVGGLARSGLDGTDEPKPPRSSVPETSHSGVAEGSKAPKKSVKFRGVHRHRLTGKWRAATEVDGKAVHLGTYATAEEAARVYDKAALFSDGPAAILNFPPEQYAEDAPKLAGLSWDELIAALRLEARRRSSGARYVSSFRGVNLLREGKWRVTGNLEKRPVSLGIYATEEEAGAAYDRAELVKHGSAAKLNFPRENYAEDVKQLAVGADRSWDEVAAAMRLAARGPRVAPKWTGFRGVRKVPSGNWQASIYNKGRVVSLGTYASEEEAAAVHDKAELCRNGPAARLNFPRETYADNAKMLAEVSWDELVAALRLEAHMGKRGQQIPRFRGVGRVAGKWQAKVYKDKKLVSLGSWANEEEAARVVDRAELFMRGSAAKLNFPRETYAEDAKMLAEVSWDQLVAASRSEARRTKGGRQLPRYRGVGKAAGRWRACIQMDSKLVSLGTYATEEQAAVAYDKAALFKRGSAAKLNFPRENYADDAKMLAEVTWDELVAALRWEAREASKGPEFSKFRGVFRTPSGRWQVSLYVNRRTVSLGAHATEEEAASVYDKAELYRRGSAAKLNFPRRDYTEDSRKLAELSWDEVVAAFRLEARRASTGREPSRFRGVRLTRLGRWQTMIYRKETGAVISLGTYATEEEAAAAYDKAMLFKKGPAATEDGSWDEMVAAARLEARKAKNGR